jgi:lipopolysaccharide/colanic/teichoic acid biosynthesis glycosyltransferase
MPIGASTLIEHVGSRIAAVTHRKVRVITDFAPCEGYTTALRRAFSSTETVMPLSEFGPSLCNYEPSDWVLIVDARYVPARGFDPASLIRNMFEGPPTATHLVALEENAGGTRDRVEFDPRGLVRRIQRYYDDVTWSVASGVICSLVPVSCAVKATSAPLTSLAGLRTALAAQGVPSRDIPVRGGVYDLCRPGGLLGLTELVLSNDSGVVSGVQTYQVDPTARIMGQVVLHPGAVVEAGATILGPSVIGAGARVGEGAVIAQSVVTPGTVVSAGRRERSRVITDDETAREASEPIHPAQGDDMRQSQKPQRLYPRIKTVLEAAIALVALIVLSPLLLLIAIMVKLDSRGSIFYGDLREAAPGRVFRCFKFRTMAVGADARQRELMAANQVDGPQFKLTHDPRVTRVGRFLRATSLDELPQLFNVLLGQMSLVGPRPSPFRENQLCVPWRDARLSVKPGITGLWQVCRHSRSGGDFHQWISYDLEYVRHMSLWVDLKILAATVVAVAGRRGHVPLSWIIRSDKPDHN